MLFLLGLAAAASPAAAAPSDIASIPRDCPGDEVGGTIAAIEPLDRHRRAGAGQPLHVYGPETRALAREGDPLCSGEHLLNPTGSGVRVVAVLAGGRRVDLVPGDGKNIAAPTLRTKIRDVRRRINGYFSEIFGTGTRGEGEGRDTSVTQVYTVDRWGPLVLYWPTDSAGKPEVRVDGRNLRQAGNHDLVSIDLRRDCQRQCAVTIAGVGGKRLDFRLHVMAEAEAPRPDWLDQLGRAPEDRALLGAWLVYTLQDERWRAQGLSLMLSGACAMPASMRRLREHYPDLDARTVCRRS